jgi:hypothetical protein
VWVQRKGLRHFVCDESTLLGPWLYNWRIWIVMQSKTASHSSDGVNPGLKPCVKEISLPSFALDFLKRFDVSF